MKPGGITSQAVATAVIAAITAHLTREKKVSGRPTLGGIGAADGKRFDSRLDRLRKPYAGTVAERLAHTHRFEARPDHFPRARQRGLAWQQHFHHLVRLQGGRREQLAPAD